MALCVEVTVAAVLSQYDNIHGSGASSAISFSCLHGGGPPTNATATPVLRDGYGVTGKRTCAYVQTLEETPIDGLFFNNISITGSCDAAFSCASLTKTDIGTRGERKHYQLFANGKRGDPLRP